MVSQNNICLHNTQLIMKNIYVISLSGVSVINPSTKVYKNAKTLGKCKICEKPFGGEKVFGEAKVFGGFPVYGNAETYGKHRIISVSKKNTYM